MIVTILWYQEFFVQLHYNFLLARYYDPTLKRPRLRRRNLLFAGVMSRKSSTRKSLTREFSQQSAQASLRRVLIIPFVLQIVAVIILIGWLSLENGQQAVNNVASQLRSSIIANIENRLEDYLSVPELITKINIQEIQNRHLDLQSSDKLVAHMRGQIKTFDSVNYIQFGAAPSSLKGDFTSLERFDAESLWLSISGAENNYQFSTYNLDAEGNRGQLINSQADFDLQRQPWYEGAVQAGKPIWSPIYTHFHTPRLAITYSAPIYETKGAQIIDRALEKPIPKAAQDPPAKPQLLGVTGVDLPLSQIGKFLKTLVAGKLGQTFIIDRSGLLVASSGNERPFLVIDGQTSRLRATSSNVSLIQKSAAFLNNKWQNLKEIQQTQQLDFSVDGEKILIQVAPLKAYPELDWLMVVVNPESDFMAQINTNRQTTIYLCLGAFGLALITGWYTSQRVLQPIKSLSGAADALSRGEWNQHVDIYSQGELGVLARAFNRMAGQLQDSFVELQSKEEKASSIATLLKEAQKVAHVGSWERDPITQKVSWSEEVFRIFGIEPQTEALPYQEYLAKIHPDDRLYVAEVLARSPTAGDSHQMEYRLIRPDGSLRYVFSKGLYGYDEENNFIRAFGIVMDVTERKEAELAIQNSALALQQKANELETTLGELQQTQSQLIQGEKMSALGQLVAGVAHEINNPVNFIYGNLTHARTYANDLLAILRVYQQVYPEPGLEVLEKIEDVDLDFIILDLPKLLDSMQVGADRIREIVKSLRSFSRLDEAEMKSVDIHEGLDSTLMILQNRLKAKGNQPDIVVVKNYGHLPQVECYAGQLNQVFMNILGNAIDALETSWEGANGTSPQIQIQTLVTKLEEKTQSLQRDNTWIQISIRDNGAGIKPELINRLFDPFFTTKPVGKGTGLGLAISHSIVVEKHDGKLNCFSEPGKGTEFLISIPIRQENRF